MRGLDVLHYVVKYAEPSIRSLLTFAGATVATPDYYVFHQANRILNGSVTASLGIDAERTPETLSDYGNTSCASIPVTVCRRLGQRVSIAPSTLLLSGFGTGFSWGSALIRTDRVLCPDVVELRAETVNAW
jgi:3-oxoacyl-[acyl-carrier-protein] synthase-3